jgi:hypothetical protein
MWMLRNGTPWFLKRSVDLLPGLIWLSGAEIIDILRQRYARFTNALKDLQSDLPQEFLATNEVKI